MMLPFFFEDYDGSLWEARSQKQVDICNFRTIFELVCQCLERLLEPSGHHDLGPVYGALMNGLVKLFRRPMGAMKSLRVHYPAVLTVLCSRSGRTSIGDSADIMSLFASCLCSWRA